jgi:hypothetical protein
MAVSQIQMRQAVAHLERGDWQSAHEIVQKDEESALACWAHGIVHVMEGDIPNARYWYTQAKRPFPEKPDAAAETRRLKNELGESRS